MALFRSERGIGRGEVPESRLEVPIFALFMLVCAGILVAIHLRFGNMSLTLAFAVSMLVFGITAVRVEFGVYILVLAMLLSPEIVADSSSGEHSVNVRYDDLLIVVIFLGVMVKLVFDGRFRPWRPSPINAGIFSYYGVCVVSTLLALERNLGAWHRQDAFFVMLKMLEFYMIFFLVGHAIRNLSDIKHQLVLFFLVALIVCGYAVSTISTEMRVGAPFDEGGTEPNTLGGYLTVIMCVALGLFTQARGWPRKALFLGIILLAFLPFLHTLSRASYVSLVVGTVAISLVSRKFYILILLGVVLASSSIIMPEKVKERVLFTFQAGHGEDVSVGGRDLGLQVDKSTNERILVWRKVGFILKLGPQFLLLGAGVAWESVLDSQYARIILETGLLGILAFAFMQYRILKTLREAYRWTDSWLARGIAMGVFGAAIALIVHGAGTISFLIVRIMEPYWFLVAVCVVIREEALEKHYARYLAQKQRSQAPPAVATVPVPSPQSNPA